MLQNKEEKKNMLLVFFGGALLYLIYKFKSKKTDSFVPTKQSDFINPIEKDKYKITSRYGMRNGNLHNGIDLMAAANTPLRAVANGKVDNVWTDTQSGNAIRINVGDFITGYAHMIKPSTLQVGDIVKKGDIVGYVGTTGNSTGNHLHFTVRKKNEKGVYTIINPEDIFDL